MTEYRRNWKDFLTPFTCVRNYHKRAEEFIGKHPKIDRYIETNSQILSAYSGVALGLTTILAFQGLEALLK